MKVEIFCFKAPTLNLARMYHSKTTKRHKMDEMRDGGFKRKKEMLGFLKNRSKRVGV